MRFEKHVFISYGHIDNLSSRDEEQPWVTRFHEDLKAYLSTNLGRAAEIWRDDRLSGNSLVEDEIVDQFHATATLVSVLSKRYLESEWCRKEIDAFCRAAERNGGLVIRNKTRVLKVMLRPFGPGERDSMPAILRDAIGYEFYQEVEGSRFLPLAPKFGNAEAYHRKVYFLAEDVAALVQQLEQPTTGGDFPEPAHQPKPVVYLAECSYDRADERQKLRDELRANGYSVLPAREARLPELEAEYVEEVGRLAGQCDLSIHLIGCFPGKVPDGPSGKSAVQLQNEIAAKLSAEGRLVRIISLPVDGPQKSGFVDILARKSELQRGADLVTGDFEELKSVVRAALKKIGEQKTDGDSSRAPGGIYIICVEEDLEAVSPVVNCLSSEGFRVELPVFSGDPVEVRQANEAVAMTCDAVVLFCGAGDGAWVFHQRNELKRVAGLRRRTPWRAQWLYLAGPATPDKRALLLKNRAQLMNGMDGFAPKKILPLIDSLSD
jgi:hypothetical protein